MGKDITDSCFGLRYKIDTWRSGIHDICSVSITGFSIEKRSKFWSKNVLHEHISFVCLDRKLTQNHKSDVLI